MVIRAWGCTQSVCEICTDYGRYGIKNPNKWIRDDLEASFPKDDEDGIDCDFPDDTDMCDEEVLNAIPWRDVLMKK